MTLQTAFIEFRLPVAFFLADLLVVEEVAVEHLFNGEECPSNQAAEVVNEQHFIFFGFVQPDGVTDAPGDECLFQPCRDGSGRCTHESHNLFQRPPGLALDDGRRKEYFPGSQGGEVLLIFCQQAVKEGGTTAHIADDENRFTDRLLTVCRVENFIQQKTDPGDDLPDWEYDVEND